jgi:integrase
MFAAVATRRPELLPWLACAAYTGARVSEIDHLAWENISFDRNFVEIESSKGGPRLVGWFLCRRR